MSIHSVYAKDDALPTVVADRFRWSAMLLPPVHAAFHRAWLMLVVWLAGSVAIGVSALWLGGEAAVWLYGLFAIWLGFAAPEFTSAALHRRGFVHRGEMIAADEDLALAGWLSRK